MTISHLPAGKAGVGGVKSAASGDPLIES